MNTKRYGKQNEREAEKLDAMTFFLSNSMKPETIE